MENFELIVTSASGVESCVKKELLSLGYTSPKAVEGKISIDGNGYDIAKLNMFLSCANRVFLKLTTFRADTFDMLFECVNSFDWIPIIPFNAKINVTGKSKNSKLFSVSDIQSIIKKAIVTKLSAHYGKRILPESGAEYGIEFLINNDEITLMLNTSGDGLHKRGYRDLVGSAPIKETLASALLDLSDFSAETPFCDPFCGSGTIVIEAARKALKIAPGRDRKFAYCEWDFIPADAYKLAYEQALDEEIRSLDLNFAGYDIDKNAISLAMRHAERAGVRKYIHLQVRDVAEFKSKKKNGCIITNPPYGERLLDIKSVNSLYRTLGQVYRALDNWSLYVITSAPYFEKNLGIKAERNRKLYNSNKECHFYQFPKSVK